MRRLFILIVSIVSVALAAYGQKSLVSDWKVLKTDPNYKYVYRPEPLLMVHGYNANDSGLNNMANKLEPIYDVYGLPGEDQTEALFTAEELAKYNADQFSFVHTFNWGDRWDEPYNERTAEKNTFYHGEWNTMQNLRIPTNPVGVIWNKYKQEFDVPPADDRETLETRIDKVRWGYQLPDQEKPQIVLRAHSAGGGLLTHLYLAEKQESPGLNGHGVRRFISMGSPHLGSPLADALVEYGSSSILRKIATEGNVMILRLIANIEATGLKGNFIYPLNGGMEDMMVEKSGSGYFLSALRSRPVPKEIEYVFNVYGLSSTFGGQMMLQLGGVSVLLIDDSELTKDCVDIFCLGDGIVPAYSQAGKMEGSASIYKNVDPVILGKWGLVLPTEAEGAFHIKENEHEISHFKSLDGVPYKWGEKEYEGQPGYADYYDENQAFSKDHAEQENTAGRTLIHSDRPGLRFVLSSQVSGKGALLIDTQTRQFDYEDADWAETVSLLSYVAPPTLIRKGRTSCKVMAITGCKHSGHDDLRLGSEYWPDELRLCYSPLQQTVIPSIIFTGDTDPNQNGSYSNSVHPFTKCLSVVSKEDKAASQYGFVKNLSLNVIEKEGAQIFSGQAVNRGGLVSEQESHVFFTINAAEMVADTLRALNEREIAALTLTGPFATNLGVTAWQIDVKEIVELNTGVNKYKLRYLPKSKPVVQDLFALDHNHTNIIFTPKDWSIEFIGDQRPAYALVSYTAYLGTCDTKELRAAMSTLTYGHYKVPADPVVTVEGEEVPLPVMEDDALEGINGDLVGLLADMRWAVNCLYGAYYYSWEEFWPGAPPEEERRAHFSNGHWWTYGYGWLPIEADVIEVQHFEQVKDAVAKLIRPNPPTVFVTRKDCGKEPITRYYSDGSTLGTLKSIEFGDDISVPCKGEWSAYTSIEVWGLQSLFAYQRGLTLSAKASARVDEYMGGEASLVIGPFFHGSGDRYGWLDPEENAEPGDPSLEVDYIVGESEYLGNKIDARARVRSWWGTNSATICKASNIHWTGDDTELEWIPPFRYP